MGSFFFIVLRRNKKQIVIVFVSEHNKKIPLVYQNVSRVIHKPCVRYFLLDSVPKIIDFHFSKIHRPSFSGHDVLSTSCKQTACS